MSSHSEGIEMAYRWMDRQTEERGRVWYAYSCRAETRFLVDGLRPRKRLFCRGWEGGGEREYWGQPEARDAEQRALKISRMRWNLQAALAAFTVTSICQKVLQFQSLGTLAAKLPPRPSPSLRRPWISLPEPTLSATLSLSFIVISRSAIHSSYWFQQILQARDAMPSGWNSARWSSGTV